MPKRKSNNFELADLMFADDADFISDSREQAVAGFSSFQEICRDFGMTVSVKKTKLTVGHVSEEDKEPIDTGGTGENQYVEHVDTFTYLGSVLQNDGGCQVDLDARIQKASVAFGALRRIFLQPQLSGRTKVAVFVPSTSMRQTQLTQARE